MDNQRPEHPSMMHGELSGLEDIPASALEPTFMVTDDIHQESQTAQLFFESLLQSSRSQLLSDCHMSSGEISWMDEQIGAPRDVPVSDNMPGVVIQSAVPSVPGTDTFVVRSVMPSVPRTDTVVVRSVIPSVPGTDSIVVRSMMPSVAGTDTVVVRSVVPSARGTDTVVVRSVTPQVSGVVISQPGLTSVPSNVISQSGTSHPVAVTISHSSSGSSVSPKKRSRREQSGTVTDSREGRVSGRQSQCEGHISGRQSQNDDRISGRQSQCESRMSGRQSQCESRMSGRQSQCESRMSGRQSQCESRMSGRQSQCESRMSGRQSQCESRMSGRESQCDDRMDAYSDGGSSCVSLSQDKRDSVDAGSTSRRRGSHLSDGGRRSRERSESEGDMVADIAMLSSYTSDDARRQMTGSVTPETSDVGFQPSMLDAVLTEKKMALLRSPEVRQFLFNLQSEKAKEQTRPHSSPSTRGDNPS
ncbi:uncharacterized protein LOC124149613 [Haliotis rufescens]|uniref:uncharacterized protein LOC124149613 n=1 Tax=Haliotis rufescens TaxID=6454 RepID=UPI00201F008C|nr:uncharacterized protein LOC124149613 [Haliotis rufescens]